MVTCTITPRRAAVRLNSGVRPIKSHVPILLSVGVIVAFVHNSALRYLVYSSICCFYTEGCKLPAWHGIAGDALYFPFTLLSDLVGPISETTGAVLSGAWGISATLIAWALYANFRNKD